MRQVIETCDYCKKVETLRVGAGDAEPLLMFRIAYGHACFECSGLAARFLKAWYLLSEAEKGGIVELFKRVADA